MANVHVPDGDGDELQRVGLLQPQMAKVLGALTEACYRDSKLPIREKEAARMRIAHINGCVVCSETRMQDGASYGIDESFYTDVDDPTKRTRYTERERMAIEFAERYAWGKHTMDDGFWTRLHAAFGDEEIVDLAICCINFLGGGRFVAVLDLSTTCPIRIVAGQAVKMDVPSELTQVRVA
jgi:alkylhydroperoxidase family enzyme